MFICEACLNKDRYCIVGFDGHFMKSIGRCEICEKGGVCVDCKCHHNH